MNLNGRRLHGVFLYKTYAFFENQVLTKNRHRETDIGDN